MEIQHTKTWDIVKANIYGKFVALNIFKNSQEDWLLIFLDSGVVAGGVLNYSQTLDN